MASPVRVPGRRRSCAAVAAKVARFSFTTRIGATASGSPSAARRSPQTRAAIASAGRSTKWLAALTVTETMPGRRNAHSAVPPISPRNPALATAAPGAASVRKCRFRIASNRSGTTSPGSRSAATQGGTASTTASPAATATAPSGVSSPATRPSAMRSPAIRRPVCRRPPRAASQASAGSTRLSDSPSRANSGTQARPPRSSVSSTTGRSSAANACSGRVFSAATASGSSSRRYSAPPPSTSATVAPGAARPSASSLRYSRSRTPGTARPRANTHHGNRPAPGRTVQRAPVARSMNGKNASPGPASVPRAPIRSR